MSNFLNKSIKRIFLTSILAILGGRFLCADQIAVTQFKYLNSNENSTIIDPAEAQDLLNVDITPGGKSVKKRPGYGLYKQVFTTSSGVHGGFHAFDSTGNDVQIWASSVSVKGIVADGTPTTIVSSMTVNSTLDCADTQGSIYCVDSNRDFFIRTNGTTLTQWYTSPLGTMIEATPDRVVVAGVSASPNTIFVSQSNTFTNFTIGVNATDAFTEVIASPGSHLTHIRWGCQRLLWWKDQSFGYFDFDDQYSAQVKIVSDNIGSFDNTSAIDPGGNIWFRGQDGHTYKYDCSALEKETVDITPQIQTSGRRTTNSWTQTTQSDWQSGTILPTGQLSTTLSPGDVIVSSFQVNEYSAATGWSSGSASSSTAIGTSSISVILNNTNVDNYSFETGSVDNWANGGGGLTDAPVTGLNCTISARTGSKFVSFQQLAPGATITARLQTCTGTDLSTVSFTEVNNSCSWTAQTLSSSGQTGKSVRIVLDGGGTATFTSDCFINSGTNITLYSASDQTRNSPPPQLYRTAIDDVTNGKSSIGSGSFTSQRYDSGVTSATYQISDLNYTANSSTPTFSLLTASNSTTGPWTQILTSSGTNAIGHRYSRFVSTLSVSSSQNALTYISSFTVVARSSGTFYSVWKNAPNLAAWNTFNPTTQDNGGSHAFYVRSSTSPQSVLNTTVTWVSQSANAQFSASTGTYFQVRDDFSITAATNTPILSDFTVNWTEGSASDQAYMLYFDNAIWESVAYGVGVSSNNYIFRRDLINEGWGLYGFGAGGMLIQGNRLFFGSVGDGNVFQFGSGTSDNGSAMSSYWKSKDFTGSDPFLQSQLTQIDTFAKKNQSQSLTATYSLDTSTSTTAYSIPLSTTTAAFIQSRKLLPSGKLGYTFNVQYGDNTTTSAWELLGFRVGYLQQPYRPSQ